MKPWITALRLRTLPLALSCIGMGSFLAAIRNRFDITVFSLCCLTTVLLQILSNLANDYGDSLHGADHSGRQGPRRAVQSGLISSHQMKTAVKIVALLCLASGLLLLWVTFGLNWRALGFFFLLGLLCIAAAVAYTAGKKPYGYAGLGDLSVLIFFGLVGVMGSSYLFSKEVLWAELLPALSCGLFSVAVLNINNIRDIESDRAAGKFSIPVRIGKKKAIVYQWALLTGGFLSTTFFVIINYQSPWQFIFMLTLPLLIGIGKGVATKPQSELDPYLKRMALTTLLFVILFGVGQII